jgi:branched-chain amino acid transport system ATP-binding protein
MTNPSFLKIVDISKSFRGLRALSRVSFELREGEIFGLIGPNGAGKTTLFNVISGFLRPDSGSVGFLERDLVGPKPHVICRMGLVRTFQIVKPFSHLSILENVVVGTFNTTHDIREAEGRAWEVLRFVGLEKKALSPAMSTTTPDRKRLELARALASRPRMLLLDEVMAGLNPTEQMEIVGLVREVRAKGVTILVIEHAMRVIMGLCDRIAVLNHGECIANGDPRAICSDKNVIEAYLGKGNTFVRD